MSAVCRVQLLHLQRVYYRVYYKKSIRTPTIIRPQPWPWQANHAISPPKYQKNTQIPIQPRRPSPKTHACQDPLRSTTAIFLLSTSTTETAATETTLLQQSSPPQNHHQAHLQPLVRAQDDPRRRIYINYQSHYYCDTPSTTRRPTNIELSLRFNRL